MIENTNASNNVNKEKANGVVTCKESQYHKAVPGIEAINEVNK